MQEKEMVVRKYFNMWLDKNFEGIEVIFDPNIYYSECYGPEYQGLSEIRQWIDDSLKRQTVIEWKIKHIIHSGNILVVEWYFRDCVHSKEHEFDGVSIIEFTNQNVIKSIKEFESRTNHIAPYR